MMVNNKKNTYPTYHITTMKPTHPCASDCQQWAEADNWKLHSPSRKTWTGNTTDGTGCFNKYMGKFTWFPGWSKQVNSNFIHPPSTRPRYRRTRRRFRTWNFIVNAVFFGLDYYDIRSGNVKREHHGTLIRSSFRIVYFDKYRQERLKKLNEFQRPISRLTFTFPIFQFPSCILNSGYKKQIPSFQFLNNHRCTF